MSKDDLSKQLGVIEYLRVSDEIKKLKFDKRWSEPEIQAIRRYLQARQQLAEQMMNPKQEAKPHFSS